MPEGFVDLHCHSTASDGSDSPAALMALAGRTGMQKLEREPDVKEDGVGRQVLAGQGRLRESMTADRSITLKEGRDPEWTCDRNIVSEGDEERGVRNV